MEEENVVIKGYKGFDKELKCRGFLYEVDKEYEQGGEIKCCNNGFHFCENPIKRLLSEEILHFLSIPSMLQLRTVRKSV